MRVSLRWLQEFVDVYVGVEELAERLSFSGTKVEAIKGPATGISDVVVGEVLAVADHPDADNLVLVNVKVTEDETYEVVCGARNFAVGDRVPLARVGARLPGIEVGERKIRGRMSQGMLCSPAELGVSKDHSGILVLPADVPLGEDVVAALGLDDSILELELTPNRPDLMSVVGVAREVSALLGHELRLPQIPAPRAEDVASPVAVEIEDARGCPRYVARYIEGVKVAPAPSWMATRLLAAGLRPISNVVDATNYVLVEMGHPLHPFDAARVREQRIVVRRAMAGERLRTLDGVERPLVPDDLVIADPERPLALAGIMGGADSEVTDATTSVILESAYFDHASIAFTSRRHLLRTEASARFERGADPEAPPRAAARAAHLIADLANGHASGDEVDAYPQEIARRTIELRAARTSRVLGIDLPAEAQVSYLQAIDLPAERRDGVIRVEVPGFRPDLQREIDLIEEVARLAGLARLPSRLPPGSKGGLERDQLADRAIRRVLAGAGLDEAWTASFMSPDELDALGLRADHAARSLVRLSNPTTEDRPALRTTLLPGLLRSGARNFAHRASGVALFEIARVFAPGADRLPDESATLAVVLAGERRRKSWDSSPRTWDFFSAKGIVEALFTGLRLPTAAFAPTRTMPFHPTRGARVSLAGAELGSLGELHPDVCARFDLPEGACVFELALDPLYAALPPRPKVEELPRFPPVYIDVAVVVDEGLAASEVEDAIRRAGAPEVAATRLFDLYVGDQIPSGRKSLAYALEVRAPDRTLTDEEAIRVRDRIAAELEARFGARLRS